MVGAAPRSERRISQTRSDLPHQPLERYVLRQVYRRLLEFVEEDVFALGRAGDDLEDQALLSDRATDPAHYARRVRGSDFGRRFGAAAWPNLSLADLELCADVDRFDFALPVARAGEHLVIR